MQMFSFPLTAPNTLYVSLNGSDTAPGTADQPVRTLQHCVAIAPTGGTCILASGRYDTAEDQAPLLVERDLTISGVPNAAPAVLDGSVRLQLDWTQARDNGCIYTSSPLPSDIWQLWADLSPLTPARFPNAKLSDDSVFDGAPFGVSGRRNGSLLYSTTASVPGLIVDDGEHAPSLASSNLDLSGALAVLPLGTMGSLTQGVRVARHGAGAGNFSFTPPPGTQGKGHLNLPYYFEGSCALLDHEGEWCVDGHADQRGGRLRVWLDGCADPRSVELRGKTRAYLLNATRGTRLTLRRLTLFGGTFAAPQAKV